MAVGDIHFVRVPVTLDYLAPANTTSTLVDLTIGFTPSKYDILTSTIVDVSGRNSVRKTVVTIVGREI